LSTEKQEPTMNEFESSHPEPGAAEEDTMSSHRQRRTVRLPSQRSGSQHPPEPALLTVPEAMAVLRVSRATIYALIRSRELRTVKIGRLRRVPRAAVADYVARLIEEVP
jgi:excisionase family DNA binding protein